MSDALTEILRKRASDMLAAAVEAEVAAYIDAHAPEVDAEGRRLVVRNGRMPGREILTSLGPIAVQPPRVSDRRTDADGKRMRFTSKILPPYLRKTRTLDELLPWLYLKGISTSDFPEALQALLGPEAGGISPSSIVRLKQVWREELQRWRQRSLRDKRNVYFWVDGVYFNVRLGEDDRQCVLVVVGATADGKKQLVALQDGVRESEQSWYKLLLDLKRRGLLVEPEVAVGDGALGFWKALAKVYPKTRAQRCWVHKTANVLDCLPKTKQAQAKEKIHQIWMAETREEAEGAFDHFVAAYGPAYPKAKDGKAAA